MILLFSLSLGLLILFSISLICELTSFIAPLTSLAFVVNSSVPICNFISFISCFAVFVLVVFSSTLLLITFILLCAS